MDEVQILEPNELGWEVVLRDGTVYEKKTIIHGNITIRVYDPIPFEKPENPYKFESPNPATYASVLKRR